MRVTHFPEREFSEFTVLSRDQPGLFCNIVGVLRASGMNVVSARITTSHSGTALDVFRVGHAEQPEAACDDERWEKVQRRVEEALAGKLDVGDLVARARRPSLLDRRRIVPRVGTDVEIDNRVSAEFTVLDVYTQERFGVLYAIADALHQLGLSVHLAKITTNVDQVLDVFYVTDASGRKIEDDATLGRIRRTLLAALQTLVIDDVIAGGAPAGARAEASPL
jgi:[protein-PII] uridylyltransferase